MQAQDKIHKIKFSIYKCIWNQKLYIVTADIYLDEHISFIYNKLRYEYKIYNLDILEQICLLLHISEKQYLKMAKKYKAIIKYDKYIHKNTCLFINKNDAKRFINEYLKVLLSLLYISNDVINAQYIYNYK